MKTRLRPMKAGTILDNTFSILRERFWAFQGVNLLSFLPVFIFMGITLAIVFTVSGMNQLDNFNDLFTKNGMSSIYLAILLFVDIISYIFGFIYMEYGNIRLFRDGLHNEKTPLKEIFYGIRGKRRRYFGMYLLFGLVFLPVYISAFFIMESNILLGVILMFLAIAVYSMMYFCFSMTPVVIFLENKGIFASVKRAFQLMAQYRWRIFGTFLLVYLLWYSLFWGVYILAILAVVLFMLKHIVAYVFAGVFVIIGLMALSIMISFIYGPLTAMYYNLLIRKEGYDIQLQLAEETDTVAILNDERGIHV